MNLDESIFKAYDIRGIYPGKLNETAAAYIACAFLRLLEKKLNRPAEKLKIVIGRDFRKSSEPLTRAAVKQFLSRGATVADLGLVSTNDYYFAMGHYGYDGGLMSTASHNPPEYGGFKLTAREPARPKRFEFISGQQLWGEVKRLKTLPQATLAAGRLLKQDIFDEHLEHILSFVNLDKIKPFKIVIDIGNGMTGLMIPRLFKRLPGDVIRLFPDLDADFSNRSPNPLSPGAWAKASAKVLETKADLGVMFDVDGDRFFLIDERGGFIRGDLTLLLLAKAMLKKNPGAGIVYNLICSHAVKELVAKWGGRPIRSEVGYMNLARHMVEEDGIMSGEVSGHFAFRDNFYSDNAYIALVLALETISEDGRPLSAIIADYEFYQKGDEINLQVDDITGKLAKIRRHFKDNLKDEIDGLTVEFPDWWFNVRPSNTEPLLRVTVEAKTKAELKARQKEILGIIESDAG
ncbi:MAG TPA: phosphomannomutase/phosphoglucomutase [Patescibacteria group bacterium]|nr:phosphomannomutase/phosphoglucomutase [Patescibacteria group bacterium]